MFFYISEMIKSVTLWFAADVTQPGLEDPGDACSLVYIDPDGRQQLWLSPAACSQSPSAAWPQQLSPNPNWNPETKADWAGWPDTEELWLQVPSVCSSLQKAC